MSSEPSLTPDEPQHEVGLELYSAAETVLADIDAALHRIDTGAYGVCQGCHGEIPIDRLEVLPMVGLCVPCQAADEERRRRDAWGGTDV
jgi:RNA polymerase-binding transcription factor DksA